jgi:hypothetical protein
MTKTMDSDYDITGRIEIEDITSFVAEPEAGTA